jgi:peptidoglycan/LPS O-acetylase OafA/YrhL
MGRQASPTSSSQEFMAGHRRIETIDSLRGLAAFAVVLYHYVGFIPLMGIQVGAIGAGVVAVTRYGYLGVPVFFVVSGCVIAMTAARHPVTAGTGTRFILRRLVRLVPPYWVMVAVFAGTILAGKLAGAFKSTSLTPAQVAAHLGYAQNVLGFPPLDVVYWTLCLEVQFYVVFTASAVAVRRLRPGYRVGWFIALTVGSLAADLANAVPPEWFPRYWYQFGAGVLVFYAGRERLAQLFMYLFIPALVVTGVYRGQPTDVAVAVVCVLLTLVAREARVRSPWVLLGLGRISYSLYLVHGFIGLALGIVFRSSLVKSESAAWMAIGGFAAVAVGAAALFYWAIELRAVEWSRLVRVGPERPPLVAELTVGFPESGQRGASETPAQPGNHAVRFGSGPRIDQGV